MCDKNGLVAVALYSMWIAYSTMPLQLTGLYMLLPMNETYSARFLYRLEHVVDVDKYYSLLMLHGFVSIFFIVAVPIAIDSIFLVCIHHVCALFEIIR